MGRGISDGFHCRRIIASTSLSLLLTNQHLQKCGRKHQSGATLDRCFESLIKPRTRLLNTRLNAKGRYYYRFSWQFERQMHEYVRILGKIEVPVHVSSVYQITQPVNADFYGRLMADIGLTLSGGAPCQVTRSHRMTLTPWLQNS